MKPSHFALAPLLALALIGSTVVAGDKEPAAVDPSLEDYSPLVAEFDRARRVNIFPNPQTLFDGLQVGFVNVGSGNLTFLGRDLATRANGPLVFGRVYDSRLNDDDFGPGWRLSLAEELHIDDTSVTYVDGAGVRRRFVLGADSYRALEPTPRHEGTRIVFGENVATLRKLDGSMRTFEPVGADGPWRLLSLDAGGRRLEFRYDDDRLESVVHGTRTMFHIQRDGTGMITSVVDDHGRSVRYSYTAQGQLKDVYDIAGELWWHEYDAGGRLTTAIGANRQPYLEVGYDAQGRVRESRTGREYTFTYETDRTIVTEGTGQRHVFTRNADGTTVAFSCSSGVVRVTERPTTGEHAGTEDMSTQGDFDGNGSLDEAYFVRTNDTYALVLALSGVDELKIMEAEVVALSRAGVSTLPPGKYTAHCADRFARRGKRDCPEGELRELLTEHDSVLLFTYEAAAKVLYWDDGQLYELYWAD